MEIDFKRGLGDIKFGMKEDEVIAQLGKPDKTILDEEYDEIQLSYYYNDLKLTLSFFNKSEGKLGYIKSSNPHLTYKNEKIIGMNINLIKDRLFKNISEWEFNEYGDFDKYWADHLQQYWIAMDVEYEVVTHFEFGVPLKNNEEYDWPTL